MPQPLSHLVSQVGALLKQTGKRIVFAESCTAGLVSATLARVPGISEFHCGSAVVYRLNTKTKWLGVSPALLENPGPVSEEVATAMVLGALERTPEADMAASITGHLGPNAPEGQDGLVYIGLAYREPDEPRVELRKRILPAIPSDEFPGVESLREWRQWKATELVLHFVQSELERP